MMRRTMTATLVLGRPLALGACSSQDPDPAETAASSTSTASSSTSATTTSSSTSASGYDAAGVCAYVKGQLAPLKAIGTPVGAHANLTGNLFNFLQEHNLPLDGSQVDAATLKSCPDVRTQILTVSGLASLADI